MKEKVIYLAGGCFWGMQKYFDQIQGVISTRVGYANGTTNAPTYEQVKENHTGHAETLQITYDADIVGLDFLLHMYYQVIDPVSVNKQGGDAGAQYRTGIYYSNKDDEERVTRSLEELQKQFSEKLAVEHEPLLRFDDAEEYHQKYLEKNPGGYCHIGAEKFKMAAQAKPKTDE